MNCEKIWNCDKCENEFGNGRDFCRGCLSDLNVWNEEEEEDDCEEELGECCRCGYETSAIKKDEIELCWDCVNGSVKINGSKIPEYDKYPLTPNLKMYFGKEEEEEEEENHCCIGCENPECELVDGSYMCKECLEAYNLAKLQKGLKRKVEMINGALLELIDPRNGGLNKNTEKFLIGIVRDIGCLYCEELKNNK